MLNRIALPCACAAALATAPAAADTRIEYVREKDGAPVTTTWIAAGKVRIDNLRDESSSVIFDNATGSLTILRHKDKKYTVLDKATLERLAQQLNAAMQQLEAQLAALPPAQRDMMKKMMGGMANVVEPTVKRSGKTLTVAGYRCQIVEYVVGETFASELCVVSPGDIKIPPADYDTLLGMQRTLAQLTRDLLKGFATPPDANRLEGLPVRMHAKGEPSAEVLKAIRHDAVPADTFALPAGYTEEKIAPPQ